ncbi:Os05g0302750, partial [Oryza sativa Japonica Group]
LKVANKNDWLERIIHSKVQPTIDNDTNTGDVESTVQTSNTIRRKGLAVNINKSIELPPTTLLCSLGIISQTSTSIIQRI